MAASQKASVIGGLSRIDRAAGRTMRERERKLRATERRRAGAPHVAAHEALIARLTEAHKVDFKRIDWDEIERTGLVAPAIARDAVSAAARKALQNYQPTFFEMLLGTERERRRELTDKVVEAARADAELWAKAKAEADRHNRMLALAPDVRTLKLDAIAGVLKLGAAAYKDVVEGFSLHIEDGRLIAQLDLIEFDALPDEVCKSVPGGGGYAEMPEADRRQLQLANACSVSLRAAVEVLQVAPVQAVEVVARVCRPGGLAETDFDPVLHVKVPTMAFAKLQLKKLDAAPAVAAFSGKLDWTAEEGFTAIDLAAIGLGGMKAVATAA